MKLKNHYFNIMEVKTKYNLRDKVWVIFENKATEKFVTQIDVFVGEPRVKITYELNYTSGDVDESKLFTSKAELLKSL